MRGIEQSLMAGSPDSTLMLDRREVRLMPKIAAEVLIERLIDWGVDTIFGLPGDGINGIMEGLRRHQDRIRFVLVHHEEAAAFMATGYAKSTGRLGVCLATSGPGAIHLLNGLYDAKLDHAPVLAITGMQESQMLGTGYQQEVRSGEAVHRRRRVQRDDPRAGAVADARRPRRPPRPGAPDGRPPDHAHRHPDRRRRSQARCERPAPAVIKPTAPIFLPASGPAPSRLTSTRRQTCSTRAPRWSCWSGPVPSRARDEVLADGRASRQPDRQDAARQGGRPR